jgi:indole-3-glycerol phosphate synthase
MSDALTRICAEKRIYVKNCKAARPLSDLVPVAKAQESVRGFEESLSKASLTGYGLIAEIKKASPSAGLIRPDFDPGELALDYQTGGATCLSVLTDIPFFQGDNSHLEAARTASILPILRKDFIIDPYQVWESRALGADCILLILAALDDKLVQELESIATELEMDVLLEVHSEDELERALSLQSRLIGINNRNLKTLKTDTNITKRLAPLVPTGYTLICESGLKTSKDLARMAEFGARCFLIGEALMLKPNVRAAVKEILSTPYKTKAI